MSEELDRLRSTLAELREELESVESLDQHTRTLLEAAREEMGAALQRGGPQPNERDSLIARLEQIGRDFGESHPGLSRIVGGLIDALGQIGI